MKLEEQLFRKIKAQGKSIKTAETYWHYCEDYLLRLKHKNGDWLHPSKAGRPESCFAGKRFRYNFYNDKGNQYATDVFVQSDI
jgi:hypothetical protein